MRQRDTLTAVINNENMEEGHRHVWTSSTFKRMTVACRSSNGLTAFRQKPGRNAWHGFRLEELGSELRRPEADYLRDDIYELRASYQGIHYRMLYFFHGRMAVVVSHGIVKERAVPPREIDLAVRRKQAFHADPQRHTFGGR
jgi:phage-related protein